MSQQPLWETQIRPGCRLGKGAPSCNRVSEWLRRRVKGSMCQRISLTRVLLEADGLVATT